VYHRVRQFFSAAFARVRPSDRALVERHLSPAQMALFWHMARCDQRHALDVLQTLCQAGHHDETLLQVALLHDVGKAAGKLTIWHRVAVVLLQRFAPERLACLAADGRGWKAPFAAHVRHAQVGAQWAMDAGCPAAVGELIYRHHDPDPEGELLVALQWADRQS
jgi:hypothetical protein